MRNTMTACLTMITTCTSLAESSAESRLISSCMQDQVDIYTTFVCKLKLSQIIFIFNNPIVMRNGDAESILLKVTNLKSITETDLCKCLFTIVTCWLVESLVCTTNTIMYHMLTWSEERSRHILQQLQLTTRSSPPGFLSWWWLSDILWLIKTLNIWEEEMESDLVNLY